MDRNLSWAPLGRYCTFLAGGRAQRLTFAYNLSELAEDAADGALVLGRGSNVLVGDAGYFGDVVINRADARAWQGSTCVSESGVLLSLLAREYAAAGRTGLEWAYGLPGSIGGAVIGNAGAFGGCIADAVLSVTVLQDGRERTLTAQECGFAYRHSEIKGTVLRVVLRADEGDPGEIRAASERNLQERRRNQPAEASGGSVFKAADGVPAAVYIDRAGLKGLTCGGAEISRKHANFIVNHGGAKAGDILQLMNVAQAVVYEKFGVRLQREIKLLGEFF